MGFWLLRSNDSTVTDFVFLLRYMRLGPNALFAIFLDFRSPSPSLCGLPIPSEILLLVHVIYIDDFLLHNKPILTTEGRISQQGSVRPCGRDLSDLGIYTAKRTEHHWPRVLRLCQHEAPEAKSLA